MTRRADRRCAWTALAAAVIGAAAAAGTAWAVWIRAPDWYAPRDLAALTRPDADDIRYGARLVADTASTIGPDATDPGMRYAKANLACTHCHIDGGLKRFAAPFVSVFATYPVAFDNRMLSLPERINHCMTASMNGRPLPEDGHEMQALIAYMRYLGEGTPIGIRVAGMGLPAVPATAQPGDADRGAAVYAGQCALCHGGDGNGALDQDGHEVPPVWGDRSFNASAGLAHPAMMTQFVYGNMPYGASWDDPGLSPQDAVDVARYLTSRPRPQG